jgi:hypothetical protein
MNVLMVATNRYTNPSPVMPLGACIVAEAAERAGHRVSLLDLMFEKDPQRALTERLSKEKPDVVGLSVRNIDNNDMQEPVAFHRGLTRLVETIRDKTDVPVVLGGAAVGVMPESFSDAPGHLGGAGRW